jgi:hypothetical protein
MGEAIPFGTTMGKSIPFILGFSFWQPTLQNNEKLLFYTRLP